VNITADPPPPANDPPPVDIYIAPDLATSGVPPEPVIDHHPEEPKTISTTDREPTAEELQKAKERAAYAQQRIEEAAKLRELAKNGILLPEHAPKGVSVADNMRLAKEHQGDLAWFYEMVKSGGPWDYKQGGAHPELEDFGNFNFGAVGRAFGIPEAILERGAGYYQEHSSRTSHPDWGSATSGTGSYGDDPVDQFWIDQGSRIYEGK
jgi:hypothetical protein